MARARMADARRGRMKVRAPRPRGRARVAGGAAGGARGGGGWPRAMRWWVLAMCRFFFAILIHDDFVNLCCETFDM